MPSIEKKRSNGQTTRIYFDKESDRHKYLEFETPFINVSGLYEKRIGKANIREGDKQAMMFYKAMDRSGTWKGEHTKQQIKQIYKDVL